jgi:geranylgeranyl pyrophosphate synthase
LHLAFGEGIAILVALSLLNQAYALLARATPAERVHILFAEVSRCIGSDGMIAGQAAELAFSGAQPADDVMTSRDLKTTGLMRLMLVAGAIGAGRPQGDIDALAAFGEMLGKIFQIFDDLADLSGDSASTGKSIGQDARHTRLSQARSTFLRGVKPEDLARHATEMLVSGKAMLDRFANQPETPLLKSVADFILAKFGSVEPSTIRRD